MADNTKERPSADDWPAIAKDLVQRALKSSNPFAPAAGVFSRDGAPSVRVTCSLDVHQEGFKILHIAASIPGGELGDPIPKTVLDEILGLIDPNSPYCYRTHTGLLHCIWPYPNTDEAAQRYVKNLARSKE